VIMVACHHQGRRTLENGSGVQLRQTGYAYGNPFMGKAPPPLIAVLTNSGLQAQR